MTLLSGPICHVCMCVCVCVWFFCLCLCLCVFVFVFVFVFVCVCVCPCLWFRLFERFALICRSSSGKCAVRHQVLYEQQLLQLKSRKEQYPLTWPNRKNTKIIYAAHGKVCSMPHHSHAFPHVGHTSAELRISPSLLTGQSRSFTIQISHVIHLGKCPLLCNTVVKKFLSHSKLRFCMTHLYMFLYQSLCHH